MSHEPGKWKSDSSCGETLLGLIIIAAVLIYIFS